MIHLYVFPQLMWKQHIYLIFRALMLKLSFICISCQTFFVLLIFMDTYTYLAEPLDLLGDDLQMLSLLGHPEGMPLQECW